MAAIVLDRKKMLSGFLRLGKAGWLYAVVSGAGMIFFITSLRHTTVAHVAVIYAAVPFVAAVLAWVVLRERPARPAILASFAAFAGVIVMVGFGQDGSVFGDLLAFGMTLCMAAMMVIARFDQRIPVMHAACLSALLSGLVCWPFGETLTVTGPDFLLLLAFGAGELGAWADAFHTWSPPLARGRNSADRVLGRAACTALGLDCLSGNTQSNHNTWWPDRVCGGLGAYCLVFKRPKIFADGWISEGWSDRR